MAAAAAMHARGELIPFGGPVERRQHVVLVPRHLHVAARHCRIGGQSAWSQSATRRGQALGVVRSQ